MPSSTKPGDLAILVMAVQYMVYKIDEVELLSYKRKMPCGVVWTGLITSTTN
jgi:hypothetical protein